MRKLRPGQTACDQHGGATERQRNAELVRVAEGNALKGFNARMAAKDIPEVRSAIEEHERLMAEAILFKDICREQLAELNSTRYQHQHGEQLRAEVALYERAIDRCDKILATYIRLGIAERRVKIDEQQAVMLVSVIKNILNRLDLTQQQKVLAGTVVSEELRAIEGPKDD